MNLKILLLAALLLASALVVPGPAGAVRVHPSVGPVYDVNVTEAGLPPGANWTACLNDACQTTNATNISPGWIYPNGTYPFSVTGPAGYYALGSPAPGSATVEWRTVNGSTAIALVFTANVSMVGLDFNASGLPSCSVFVVDLNGVQLTTGTCAGPLATEVAPGPWNYSVGVPQSCYGSASYCPALPINTTGLNGTVNVTDPPINLVNVTFGNVTPNATGIPNGTAYNVTVGNLTILGNGSAGASIPALPPGNYPYRASPVPGFVAPSGYVHVGGARTTLHALYTRSAASQTVTFRQASLPYATNWCVRLDATRSCSMTQRIVFPSVPVGEHAYRVSVPGYVVNRGLGEGNVLVSSHAIVQPLGFSKARYAVHVHETGLTNGTAWTMTLGGQWHRVRTAVDTYLRPNGTYRYTVYAPAGWVGRTSGSVTVDGAAVQISVVFSRA